MYSLSKESMALIYMYLVQRAQNCDFISFIACYMQTIAYVNCSFEAHILNNCNFETEHALNLRFTMIVVTTIGIFMAVH